MMQLNPVRPTLIDVLVPGKSVARTISLIIVFSFLVAISAQIAIKLPFTPVPITGQTLAVLLTGGALGAHRGAASLGLYAIWGMLGLPVFAPTNAALEGELIHLILPWEGSAALLWDVTSGGYIAGFILATYTVGKLAERGWDRGWHITLAMLIGNLMIYIPGLLWLGFVISTGALDQQLGFELANVLKGTSTLDKTLIAGFYPFVVGDLLKLYIAAIMLPGTWALISNNKTPRN